MADEVKLPLKTFRFRVKDKTSGKRLDVAAHAVNFVWNHCNGAQRHAGKGGAQRSGKKRRTQAIHATITNSRKHFLHKETTKIADAFGLICVSNVLGRLQATNRKSSADASTAMSRNMLRCGAVHDRDVEAARNILRLGRQTLAEGSSIHTP
jgi:transposase